MIFHRGDTDSQPFMDLAITELVDAVHQEYTAGLLREIIDRTLIEPQQVLRFDAKFLLRQAGGMQVFIEREDDDVVSLAPAGPVDEEVARHASQEGGRIGEPSGLGTAGGAREDFLQHVGRGIVSGAAAEIAQQRRSLVPEGKIQRNHGIGGVGLKSAGPRVRAWNLGRDSRSRADFVCNGIERPGRHARNTQACQTRRVFGVFGFQRCAVVEPPQEAALPGPAARPSKDRRS